MSGPPATTAAPARPRLARPRPSLVPSRPSAARLLWIEIRRSAMVWTLPLLAVLFVYDPYRTAGGYPAIWDVRASVVLNKLLPDFIIFTAGFAAWAGSREGRRDTGDLLATTARPAWARHTIALAGTLFWILLGFLAAVAVLYIRTASVVTWGGPPLWPVAVGVVALITVCAVGFTAGALFPGRFTAPIVAVGITILDLWGFRQAVDQSTAYALLSPTTVVPANDAGLFYPVAPDLAIAQIMFMGGLTLAALGVLGLSPRTGGVGFRGAFDLASGAGRRLRIAAIGVLAAGVAAAVTAFTLTGTARSTVSGWDIPALHDAASDRPVAYTPDCTGTAFRVCIHPAYGTYLNDTAEALGPVAAEIAGLPGAPVRAEEVAGNALPASVINGNGSGMIVGTPPVYEYSMNNAIGLSGTEASTFRMSLQQDIVRSFIVGTPSGGQGGAPATNGTPAQQAVEDALLAAVGSKSMPVPQADGSSAQEQVQALAQAQVRVAAQRFGALSPAARHAWLARHLLALRAGHVTLAQLP